MAVANDALFAEKLTDRTVEVFEVADHFPAALRLLESAALAQPLPPGDGPQQNTGKLGLEFRAKIVVFAAVEDLRQPQYDHPAGECADGIAKARQLVAEDHQAGR